MPNASFVGTVCRCHPDFPRFDLYRIMSIYLDIFIYVKTVYSMQSIIFIYVNIIYIIFMHVSMSTDKHSRKDQQHHHQVSDG